MKKQIWEIGGMNSVLPQRIATQEEDELYLVFEILEDGELGFKVPLVNDAYLNIYNRISYSKDKKTWIHTDINEYIPVKKGEIWYCKGECSSMGDYPIGQFSGINDLDKIKYNVSGNISAILDIRKENPDAEKIMMEFIELLGLEISNQQSPEEVLMSLGENSLINAIKYSDKNKTPAHIRNSMVSSGYVSDEPDLSDEEFIRHVISTSEDELSIEVVQKSLSKSCITQCIILSLFIRCTEGPPKLDILFQSEDVVDASGLVVDYSTTCNRMFASCYNLIKAPKLPMTTLVNDCYSEMFMDCTSLTTASELPATTLADGCYTYMFRGCTSLTTAPILPAIILANQCYYYMFHGCTSLTTAPELPATSLTDGCYSNMFAHCTSLTTAPKLPAMTLTSQCYYHMFDHCSSLIIFPELPATTLADYCYRCMFYGCTSLITAPELPATTLVKGCYELMFGDCNKLNNITMLATNISAYNCLNGWVSNVASNGTFTKHPDMTTLPSGVSGIPEGWTVEDAIV